MFNFAGLNFKESDHINIKVINRTISILEETKKDKNVVTYKYNTYMYYI